MSTIHSDAWSSIQSCIAVNDHAVMHAAGGRSVFAKGANDTTGLRKFAPPGVLKVEYRMMGCMNAAYSCMANEWSV